MVSFRKAFCFQIVVYDPCPILTSEVTVIWVCHVQNVTRLLTNKESTQIIALIRIRRPLTLEIVRRGRMTRKVLSDCRSVPPPEFVLTPTSCLKPEAAAGVHEDEMEPMPGVMQGNLANLFCFVKSLLLFVNSMILYLLSNFYGFCNNLLDCSNIFLNWNAFDN